MSHRQVALTHVTVPIPRKVMTADPITWTAITPPAMAARPSCNRDTTSTEKVENVVSPPQNPVLINSRHSGEMAGADAKYAIATPMM